MPFITIEMVEGRTPEQKRELVEKITKVVAETVNVPEERVFIFLEDLKKDHYAKGGKLLIDQE
ncbi:2-hydroxymuconate tautomerase [Tepidibacillus marianensis]|uniref:2-hydroxymuconate tautomerase n=1 Tax=Tepidibacillus marianensis TaxID=3131995 RepID=UPI0030D0E21F